MIYALRTVQGTAMPETAICSTHAEDGLVRTRARRSAEAADDFDGDLSFTNASDNTELTCIECGATS